MHEVNIQPIKRDRLLPISSVIEIVGIGSSTIYSRVAAGTFPKPKRLSAGCVRWRESEIDAWIDALPTEGELSLTACAAE